MGNQADLLLKIKGDGTSATTALKKVDGAIGKIAKPSSLVQGAFAAVGVTAAFALGVQAVDAARKAELSQAMLANQVRAVGGDWGKQKDRIDEAIGSLSQLSAFSKGELRGALGSLIGATKNVDQSLNLMGLAADLARNKKMDLATAAKLVGRVAQGNTSALARYGISLSKTATASEALSELQKRVAGSAATYGKSSQGMADRLANSVNGLKVALGTALLPSIDAVTRKLLKLTEAVNKLPQPVKTTGVNVGLTVLALAALGKVVGFVKTGLANLGISAAGVSGAAETLALRGMYAVDGIKALGTAGGVAAVGLGTILVGALIAAARILQVEYTPRLREARDAHVQAAREANRDAFIHTDLANRVHKTSVAYNENIRACHGSAVEMASGSGAAIAAANAAVRAADATWAQTHASDQLSRSLHGTMVAADSLAAKERTLKDKQIEAKQATLDLKDAQADLAEAKKHNKTNSEAVQRAELAVQSASLRAADATADYQSALADANAEQKRAADRAHALAAAADAVRRAANQAGAALDRMYGKGAGNATRAAGSYGGRSDRAVGNIESATPGGRWVRVAEAGDDEAIIPINQSRRSLQLLAETTRRMLGGGSAVASGGVQISITGSQNDASFVRSAAMQAFTSVFGSIGAPVMSYGN